MSVLYRALLKPFLFRMDPEDAHHLVLGMLARVSRSPVLLALARALAPRPDPRLAVDLFGLRFPSPIGLAAGLDKDGAAVPALSALGFGFVEIGSVTAEPQPGNPRPRLFRLPAHAALVNRMGFNSAGAVAVAGHLASAGRQRVPIGVNLGRNKSTPNERAAEDYCLSVDRLATHADYFVVNVSSPNTPGLRDLQRRDPLAALLRSVSTRVAERAPPTRRAPPVLVKLAPDLAPDELDDAVAAAHDSGVAGFVVSNTTLSREGVEGEEHAQEAGGLSGRPLAARSTAMVAAVHARSPLPIIGVGGIDSPDSAIAKLRAGASLLQVYTGLIYRGPGLLRELHRALLSR